MDEPKLIINSEEEFEFKEDVVSIGRSQDNDISFPDDSNVSRYHAEIERRGDGFWIIELGSFNGTKLNGSKIDNEEPLSEGDILLFGGTSKIEFVISSNRTKPQAEAETEPDDDLPIEKEDEPNDASATDTGESPPSQKASKFPILLMITAIAVGLAVIFVVAAGLFYLTREEPTCEARAKITRPERGDTIKEETEIEIDLEGSECVAHAVYLIDGREIARSSGAPFKASIDPNNHPEFSDGLNRPLKVVLYDEKGIEISQSNEVAFFIETIEVEPPAKDPSPTNTQIATNNPTNTNTPKNSQTSIKETIAMTGNVVKQFSGNFSYKTANPGFLGEVRKATSEYVSKGYFARAQKYRDVINVAYIRERNLDPPLGYILAMSRSKFLPKNSADGTGLWRMQNEFVVASAYNGLCGQETIASASQNCAAKASAHYLKDLILNVFEGDVVYGVAAFGMSLQQADAWKASLPANRADFWNVIKSPKQRKEVVNFFAAAMVAENPQKFGLDGERPLSELYAVFMKQ